MLYTSLRISLEILENTVVLILSNDCYSNLIIHCQMPHILLLVDDDEDEHLFFQWSLEKIGADIRLSCVFSSTQAVVALKETVPAMIFVDINLPGADGFDCVASIRKMYHLKDVPIYMYSTEISEGTLRRAASLGAKGCIKKTRNHDLLAKMIRENLTLPYF